MMLKFGSVARRASWTLVDQGVVSLGAFATNIVLARSLSPAEYGVFALLFGAVLMLQLSAAALIFYPASVRAAVLSDRARRQLTGAALILAGLWSLPLALALAGGLIFFGRPELVLPAVAWFLAWQFQEAMRRGLFAAFLFRQALPGDAISYLGQAAGLVALSWAGLMSLDWALWIMAGTSAIAAAVQAAQVRPDIRSPARLVSTAADFWSLGGWALGSSMISILLWQMMPWTLAVYFGPAAAGAFQAALNLVNVTNPIILGLGNVIPQAAAQAHNGGKLKAWRAAQSYALFGLPPIVVFYAAISAHPEFFLALLYGATSPFVSLGLPVRILVASCVFAYAGTMICAFLHGVDASRIALAINLIGAVAAVFSAFPLISAFGIAGACAAMTVSNAFRSIAAFFTLIRITADDRANLIRAS